VNSWKYETEPHFEQHLMGKGGLGNGESGDDIKTKNSTRPRIHPMHDAIPCNNKRAGGDYRASNAREHRSLMSDAPNGYGGYSGWKQSHEYRRKSWTKY
jgi:hypothetical protein